ncbi:hypothetical protein SAMN05421874_13340 [Nonomuraea maritima]|uniref:Uncharacterized protein n=1 Tax=Nonomuraea maritima TaxID=683260 RepID=A0A1G9P4W8_9ACTN|nr:hypothetical protein SAMN05421874_13340 [Nonomuraea maritima]
MLVKAAGRSSAEGVWARPSVTRVAVVDDRVLFDVPDTVLVLSPILGWGLLLLPTMIWVVWVVVKMLRRPEERADRTVAGGREDD